MKFDCIYYLDDAGVDAEMRFRVDGRLLGVLTGAFPRGIIASGRVWNRVQTQCDRFCFLLKGCIYT